MSGTAVWIHDAGISSQDRALQAHPDAAVLFVFDEPTLKETLPAFHRLHFIFEGVVDLFESIPNPLKEMHRGETVQEILQFCHQHQLETVAVTDHPDPFIRGIIEELQKKIAVKVYPREELALCPDEPKRFSRYWSKVGAQVLGYPPKMGKMR